MLAYPVAFRDELSVSQSVSQSAVPNTDRPTGLDSPLPSVSCQINSYRNPLRAAQLCFPMTSATTPHTSFLVSLPPSFKEAFSETPESTKGYSLVNEIVFLQFEMYRTVKHLI